MLDRSTEWRQGELLTRKSAERLNLISGSDDSHYAVVISHDCDIPNQRESSVEIIVAKVVDKVDAQMSYAKNPRRLHLVYKLPDDESLILELWQTEKRSVLKRDFSQHAKRHPATLPNETKRTLKLWLAARYGRPAFPNAFQERLSKKANSKRDVKSQIAKVLEPESEHLVALFFDFGEQRGIEIPDGEPYVLSITVVYDATEGGPTARKSAEKVAKALSDLFTKAYGTPEDTTEIALEACEAVADTHMTLADLRRVDQWRLEYLSLRDEESGGFLMSGELPV